MEKSVAILIALFFMISSCIVFANPVYSSTEAAENFWVSKAPMNEARHSLGVAAVDGKIYAIGGKTDTGVVGTNEEYDPATDTWVLKTPMPTPRDYFAIAVCQKKIYCMGSRVNEVYDPATDSWETKTPMPTERSGIQANVVEGEIYVIGGYEPNNSSSFLTLNEVYDTSTDSWTTKAPMPTATSSRASVAVDKKIYVIGGLGSEYPGLSLNQIYDVDTDTWSIGATPPHGTGYTAADATTGMNAPKRIYTLGLNEVRVYDPDSGTWTFGAEVPTIRYHFGTAIANDRLYVIGGVTHSYPDITSKSEGPIVTTQAINEQYTPFGYGTPDPSSPPTTPANTEPAPFPTVPVTAASGVLATAIGIGLFVYFKKRKH